MISRLLAFFALVASASAFVPVSTSACKYSMEKTRHCVFVLGNAVVFCSLSTPEERRNAFGRRAFTKVDKMFDNHYGVTDLRVCLDWTGRFACSECRKEDLLYLILVL